MTEIDEIKRIPLDAVTKMKQINTGHHLSDVIKGLIENSIDAHCTQILIFLENDGLSSIKVIDDGVGIPKSSLPNVCRFHYTSKIRDITKTEIVHGKSFGFMGSFLANLSCVSTVKISSKFHKEEKSNLAIYEYNLMTKISDSFEIDNGTCVEIINYLSNFPEQRIKIRKNAKEINKMIDTIAKYAIVYSWIKFEVISNDRPDLPLLKTPGNSDLFSNLISMHKLQEPLKSFFVSSFENLEDDVEAIIFLSNPRYNYSSTNNTLLRAIFLNGRLVSVPSLKNPINKMYQDVRYNMNNYFLNNPYFIFIKAPETYTNDVFNENENNAEFNDNDDSEYNFLLKEEACYFQKFKHFNFTKKIIQECYQLITDSRSPPKDYQIANEIRRIESKLINDHLCNPPRPNDTGKVLFHHPTQQQPQSPQHQTQNPHGIPVQSTLPVSSSGMQSILASPLSQKPPQQSNQLHSSYLQPSKTLQEQQSQSTSPFLATSRISSQQSIHDHPLQLQQQPNQVQVQIQPKQQTILTPKHTVHAVTKTIIKKSISPAPSTIFTSPQQQQSSSPPSSQQTTKESSSSLTSVTQSSNSINDQKISRNQSIQNISQPTQSQNTANQSSNAKPSPRVTDINDLLTNKPSIQISQPVTKRVVVRKITTAPLLIVSTNNNNNNQNPTGQQQQQQNNTTSNSGNQTSSNTSNTQNSIPASPVPKVRKVVVPPKNTS